MFEVKLNKRMNDKSNALDYSRNSRIRYFRRYSALSNDHAHGRKIISVHPSARVSTCITS